MVNKPDMDFMLCCLKWHIILTDDIYTLMKGQSGVRTSLARILSITSSEDSTLTSTISKAESAQETGVIRTGSPAFCSLFLASILLPGFSLTLRFPADLQI